MAGLTGQTMNSLIQIIKKHKHKIFGAILLLIIENILFLIHPLLIGYANDGVFIKDYAPLYLMVGVYIFPLSSARPEE